MAANTPENKVKAAIDKVLVFFRDMELLWFHRAVQMGMGNPTLDYTGVIQGRYFAIEAKAPGKRPTKRQLMTIDEIRAAGGTVFVIDDVDGDGIRALIEWLNEVSFG